MTDYKLDENAKYAKSHEWVRIEDGVAVIGISDAAQDMLSDVVFVELPEEGAELDAGTEIAVVVPMTEESAELLHRAGGI